MTVVVEDLCSAMKQLREHKSKHEVRKQAAREAWRAAVEKRDAIVKDNSVSIEQKDDAVLFAQILFREKTRISLEGSEELGKMYKAILDKLTSKFNSILDWCKFDSSSSEELVLGVDTAQLEREDILSVEQKIFEATGYAIKSKNIPSLSSSESVVLRPKTILNIWYRHLCSRFEDVRHLENARLYVSPDVDHSPILNIRTGPFLGSGTFGHVHTVKKGDSKYAVKIAHKNRMESIWNEWSMYELMGGLNDEVKPIFGLGQHFTKPAGLLLPLGMPWDTSPLQTVTCFDWRVWVEVYVKMRFIHGPHQGKYIVHRDIRYLNVVFFEDKEVVSLDTILQRIPKDSFLNTIISELITSKAKLPFDAYGVSSNWGETGDKKNLFHARYLELLDLSCAVTEGSLHRYSGSKAHIPCRVVHSENGWAHGVEYRPRCLDDIESFLHMLLDEFKDPHCRTIIKLILTTIRSIQLDTSDEQYCQDRESILETADELVHRVFTSLS
mmetsp:Transcript_35524/g.92591  ORF Transcript_35524/g.92591 Transcript_35524/m.92591 type:complete len:497 (-) Transcript_35524:21-1511(-)